MLSNTKVLILPILSFSPAGVRGQALFDQLSEQLDSYSFHAVASSGVFSSLILLSNTDLSKDETKRFGSFKAIAALPWYLL